MDQPIHLPVLADPRGGAPGASEVRVGGEPKEKCGVFGIWGHADAVRRTYLGLYAQQHRGQESAGIAVASGGRIEGVTGMGLVPEVFDERLIHYLESHYGAGGPRGTIGHNRYSTAGGSLACNAQPLVESYIGGQVALAHNGNLVNAGALRAQFEQAGHLFHTTSDTEVIIHLLASPQQQRAPDPLAATLRRLQGAFSLVFLFPDRIEACRDPWGWRPLVIGRTESGHWVVASETVALDVNGAELVREVEPGEIVRIDDRGLTSRRFADVADRPAHCVFEHVYFANPASTVFGRNVQMVREALGEALAREAPVPADYVMPMPDSGRSAAAGYARASGIPYREGIVPNRYVGRTFIKPTQDQRNAAVRLKLNVIAEIVRGKRVIVVDDSIVRGTTTKAKMDQIRAAGASEVHLRISCPPIRHPCYFGVDFAERSQLIAHGREVEDVRAFLGVDSLHYLSLRGLLESASDTRPAGHWCTACYTGDYRIDIEHPVTEIVHESEQLRIFV
ncbi:MAG: amidophosphoribosyltransferase [Phycisphaerae bacterium]|nr:amidophosphoribosyltransferase [Phycisphaerae bacterium]